LFNKELSDVSIKEMGIYLIWSDKMFGNHNDLKLVNNAMANDTRRRMIDFLADGDRNIEELKGEAGTLMDDFHLKILLQANLIELEEGTVKLSEYGRNLLKDIKEKCAEKTADLSQAKPVEISDIRQLLPCIVDPSKFRVIANMTPPLKENLRFFELLFPKGSYSVKTNTLIIQEGEIIITVYGTGKVIMTMIKNEDEAIYVLENLKSTINEAIAKGVIIPSRQKDIVVSGVDKDLPHTNCDKCSERESCPKFAEKLMSRENSPDNCTSLKEPGYAN
jgi:ArsR family metal-binding transcriptional regulator